MFIYRNERTRSKLIERCGAKSRFTADCRKLRKFFFALGNRFEKCSSRCLKVNTHFQMEIKVLLLHEHWEHLQDCCNLINSEWKRSDTARLRSLKASCDKLPTSLILLKAEKLIGHLKISPIPSIKDGCFIETVVIDQAQRGNGFGSTLMRKAEEYCKENLKLCAIFLSTKGQEGFYNKLGYIECQPISIYGGFSSAGTINLVSNDNLNTNLKNSVLSNSNNVPRAPPMPNINNRHLSTSKTYMKKEL